MIDIIYKHEMIEESYILMSNLSISIDKPFLNIFH